MISQRERKKLDVLFIDFSKAYDRVPRKKLLEVLKSYGCGKTMLTAIKAMYACTKSVFKSTVTASSVGVRQRAPTSCLLFIIYINRMVQMIKGAVEEDGFLGVMYVLLLMDGKVVLATSREKCLSVVLDYCHEYGMEINVIKTKFFVVNGVEHDKAPLTIASHVILYSSTYLYLGSWFTNTVHVKDVATLHEVKNQATINKFAIFCASNSNMPFKY